MTLENYQNLQTAVKNLMVIFTALAGIIGAFYNQKMVNPILHRLRNITPKVEVRKRIVIWFKMHTKEWYSFIAFSLFVIMLTFPKSAMKIQ